MKLNRMLLTTNLLLLGFAFVRLNGHVILENWIILIWLVMFVANLYQPDSEAQKKSHDAQQTTRDSEHF